MKLYNTKGFRVFAISSGNPDSFKVYCYHQNCQQKVVVGLTLISPPGGRI